MRSTVVGCGWDEEPDGFRYLVIDHTGSDPMSRRDALKDALAVLREERGVPLLFVADPEGVLDRAWFKAVKDAMADVIVPSGCRVALLGANKLGASVAMILNLRAGDQRLRTFDDRAAAVAWLRGR